MRAWRTGQGFTLQDVADLTGMSESMLSLVERGRRQMKPAAKVAMARRLHVRVADLFEPETVYETSLGDRDY